MQGCKTNYLSLLSSNRDSLFKVSFVPETIKKEISMKHSKKIAIALFILSLLVLGPAHADPVPVPGQVQILLDTDDFPTITGDSAYETWKSIPGNELGTEQDFIDSLKGEQGDPGIGGGAVQQVQHAFVAPGASTTSSSYVATGLSKAITPASASNKVLVQVSGHSGNAGTAAINRFTLFRKIGSGSITELTPSGWTGMAGTRTVDSGYADPFSFTWQDEPATTDEVTYYLYWNTPSGNTAYLGQRPDGTNMKYGTFMTLFEVQ
jgi:hypothetical protein